MKSDKLSKVMEAIWVQHSKFWSMFGSIFGMAKASFIVTADHRTKRKAIR